MLSNINEIIVLKYLYIFLMHTDIYLTVERKRFIRVPPQRILTYLHALSPDLLPTTPSALMNRVF